MCIVAILLVLLGSDDKEAEEAIRSFKSAMKAPEVGARVDAVRELGKIQHERVQNVLGACLRMDEKSVRISAAKALGACQEKKARAVVLLSEALPPNATEPDVQVAILTALKDLRERVALPIAYRYFSEKNERIAEAAISISEMIRSRDSIEPLIRLMKSLIGAGDGVSTGDFDVPPDEHLQERARILQEAAQRALSAITGESFSGTREWEAWWKKNAGSFRIKE
jgi:HEAT repeat protein